MPQKASWTIEVEREAWLLTIGATVQIGSIKLVPGEAIFGEVGRADIEFGDRGIKALLAYACRDVNLAALERRHASVRDHSSPAPSIATVSNDIIFKTPEAQT